MAAARATEVWRDLASERIAGAFALSLLLHIIVIGGVELGRGMGLWKHSLLPRPVTLEEIINTPEPRPVQQAQQEPPETQLVFVEVDPAQSAPEPPPTARHYSSANALASNPDIRIESQKPNIDGNQEVIQKAFDTLRPEPVQPPPEPVPPKEEPKPALTKTQPKAEPAPEPPQPQPPKEEEKPPPKFDEGDIVVAKAMPQRPAPPPEAPQPKPRPRTLAEAKAQKGIIEGRKMKQEGGVQRHSLASSMDVRATPFGAYDAAFIAAVQARWYTLLTDRDFVGNQSGRVIVEFRLTIDGRIVDMRVVESEVTEILSWMCQRAVLDPAPYAPFPPDLRRLLRGDYRDVRFTFYYNH